MLFNIQKLRRLTYLSRAYLHGSDEFDETITAQQLLS